MSNQVLHVTLPTRGWPGMASVHTRSWVIFSCSSSSLPTLTHWLQSVLTSWLTHSVGFKAFQAKPDKTYLTYLPELPSWPTWPTNLNNLNLNLNLNLNHPSFPQKTFSTIQTLNRAVSQFLRCLELCVLGSSLVTTVLLIWVFLLTTS